MGHSWNFNQCCTSVKRKECKTVFAYITHGVLFDPAIERIEMSPIDKMIITDSIVVRDDGAKK